MLRFCCVSCLLTLPRIYDDTMDMCFLIGFSNFVDFCVVLLCVCVRTISAAFFAIKNDKQATCEQEAWLTGVTKFSDGHVASNLPE